VCNTKFQIILVRPEANVTMKELRQYQVADLAFYLQTPRCLNTSDPGTGKTASVCAYAWYMWNDLRHRVVWTMPKSLLKKNKDELIEFSGFAPDDIAIVDGTPKQRKKAIDSDAKVFLIGFTAFSNEWEQLLTAHPDINCMLVDELHMGYGGPESKRTENFYDAMEKIKYFVGMTGTIINGRLSSIYPSIQIIDPSIYGQYEYASFFVEHAVLNEYGTVVGWQKPAKIKKFLKRYAIRHSFEEIYGPEAKVIIHEKVQMDPRQREAYDEFEETALLELEDSWLDGSFSKAVHIIHCRKIMEHPQTLGAPLDVIKTTGKEDRLIIHLEDCKQSGKPMIVFAALTAQIERAADIASKMGLRVGMIHGGVSTSKRFEIDEKFRAGKIDVVIASPATTAVGYNWGHVDTMVFMSLDYMDSSFRQGYRRAIRGVRGRPLLIYILQYEDCDVEDRIFDIVQRKAELTANLE
jgi:Helicase conserved C-terminal domain/Type III restriction enzyme, res subunit